MRTCVDVSNCSARQLLVSSELVWGFSRVQGPRFLHHRGKLCRLSNIPFLFMCYAFLLINKSLYANGLMPKYLTSAAKYPYQTLGFESKPRHVKYAHGGGGRTLCESKPILGLKMILLIAKNALRNMFFLLCRALCSTASFADCGLHCRGRNLCFQFSCSGG